ncbi:MAG: ribosome biogenesis GTPase Der [Alphaproteobacteria bacterium]|nr:ribosome biogenesis GTPase Der [Alphaproteobacteria bacterium]
MTFTVAIVGRPNVGKSTLFNRLVGRRDAIVHDTPGVTRDRREGEATLFDLSFRIFDTAGLEEAAPDAMESRMRSQTERAVADADLALLLIDARAGLTPLDRHFAQALRKGRTPVIVVANKCEGRAGQPGLIEAYELGLGDPIALSAEHGEGLGELYDALRPFGPEPAAEDEDEPDDEATDEAMGPEEVVRPLHMAVVGRPNVGKSTIVNRLLGEDRMLTGPEAGLTRDSIAIPWEWNGRPVRLVDTAGLRRRATISDSLEKLSVADTLESIRMANVVVLVLDSQAILDKQDLTIARMVVEEGRALVIAINKWDLVDDKAPALARLSDRLEASLPQVRGVPTVTMSALAGRGLDKLMAAVEKIYETWNRRIPTSQLNRWLEEMTERHPPPALQGGRRLRLRYMTQAKARPPTFVAFVSKADELPESYVRYLINGLRQTFALDGVPIRFNLRKRKNPYAD